MEQNKEHSFRSPENWFLILVSLFYGCGVRMRQFLGLASVLLAVHSGAIDDL